MSNNFSRKVIATTATVLLSATVLTSFNPAQAGGMEGMRSGMRSDHMMGGHHGMRGAGVGLAAGLAVGLIGALVAHESSMEDTTTGYRKDCYRIGNCHVIVDSVEGNVEKVDVRTPPKVRPKGNGRGRVEPKRVGQFQLWPLSDGTYQVTDLNQNPVMGIEPGSSLRGLPLAPSPR